MEILWNNVKEEKRMELLKEIYGNCMNYMASYNWNDIPYGVQKRLEKFYNLYMLNKES